MAVQLKFGCAPASIFFCVSAVYTVSAVEPKKHCVNLPVPAPSSMTAMGCACSSLLLLLLRPPEEEPMGLVA